MKLRHAVCLKGLVLLALVTTFVAMAQEPVQLQTANAMSRVSKRVNPEYPAAARQLNIQGSQEVLIVVNAQGDVEDVKVVKGNAMFTAATMAAVKQWKFTPLVKDGQAEKFSTTLTVNYTK